MAKISSYEVMIVSPSANSDELKAICDQMQPGEWAADNEMTSYQPDKLKNFLSNDQNLLVLVKDSDKIAGTALCYILPHPAGDDSLYIHELDTHPNYRRQGVATKLIKELQKIAKQKDLTEVWVGTETTNKSADSLYRSLNPYEIEPSYIYAYKVN